MDSPGASDSDKLSKLLSQILSLQTQIQNELKIKEGFVRMLQQFPDERNRNNVRAQVILVEQRISFLQESINNLQAQAQLLQEPQSPVTRALNLPPSSTVSHVNMTAIDFIRSNTPLTNEKLTFRKKEARHRLEVEERVLAGTENLIDALKRNPATDQAVYFDLKQKIAESRARIHFLQKADDDIEKLLGGQVLEEDETLDIRVQRTGRLRIKLIGTINVALANGSEISAIVRVDGNKKAATKYTGEKWNEGFDVQIDKASEVELSVYDKAGPLVGFVWFKLADLEFDLHSKYGTDHDINDIAESGTTRQDEVFRRNPVQKIHPKAGHKFVAQQFYQVMQCAVCDEFLLAGTGYQCQGCQYLCHSKCHNSVIATCPKDRNAAPHQSFKIPHRFTLTTTFAPGWCSHCGYILPIGRQVMQCSECRKSCHKEHAKMMPNFCKIPRELIEKVLPVIEAAERKREAEDRKLGHSDDSVSHPHPVMGSQTFNPIREQIRPPPRTISLVDESNFSVKNSPSAQIPPVSKFTAPPGPSNTPNAGNVISTPGPYRPYQGYQGYTGNASSENRPPVIPHRTDETPNQHQHRPNIHTPSEQTQPTIPVLPNSQPYAPQLPVKSQNIEPILQEQPPVKQQISPQPIEPLHQKPQPMLPQETPSPIPGFPNMSLSETKTLKGKLVLTASSNGRPQKKPSESVKVTLNDFHFIAVLGRGAFGKVMLAEDKYSSDLYAIKALKKEFIVQNDDVKSTKLEKRVFQAASNAHHPFLVNLHSCFHNESRLYFVMEYVCGGDLMCHLQVRKRFTMAAAKFYACEVLLALQFFHSNNIIYRDLKLDNILMGPDGHIKVADYGICKDNMGPGSTTRTFCGTPDYMAPEILMNYRYSKVVDWWSFGVLIFVMLIGKYPFPGEDEHEILDAILEDAIQYPTNMPRDTLSLLQQLLNKNPAKRLGSKNDAEDIKRHIYFNNCDWDSFVRKEVDPPFVPELKHPKDVSNFDKEFTREKAVLTPIQSTLKQNEQEEFHGFSYVAEWAAASRVREES
ncbi:Serine/threonine kinase [Nowakowskiella sp. JEL0078]|nr:Serine/threonine kinase [Nowakowskiella sp. JEL0078]